MNYLAFAHEGDYWELGHKVTFDPYQKLIHVSPYVTTLDIKVELYSDYKEWFKLRDNSGDAAIAVRTTGGDPTVEGEFSGDIYFMINGWRIVIDPTQVAVNGVMFSDDHDTAWLEQGTLKPFYPIKVSSLVTQIAPSLEGLSIPTAAEVAAAVWDYSVDLADDTAGSIGAYTRGHLHDIHYLQRKVHLDTGSVTNGDGSQANPFNNITDAIDYSELTNARDIIVYDDIVLDRQLKNFRITGIMI